ncbi:MAG: ABC transporter ATP-binding protein [Roseburia sp.]|jgi:ATP-binding cassette subfamily B multidrug efflux pump|nr:ABC transporter ATP-binding protein [Roseburia sp.]PWM04228.1 MAG: multidrug ABC transporter ATP-binding protein [Clostridiales bacterium]
MSGKPNKPAGGPPMGGPGHGPGGRHARAMGGKPKETKQTIKRLLGYLGKDKKHVIIALVCVVISSLSTLAGSYMLSPIINGITETYDKASKAAGDAGVIINEGLKTLGLGILLMLAIYGIGVISMYLQQRIMIGVSQRALKTLRKDLFDHIQTLPVRYFDTNATGDIMSRFTNDVDVVGEMLNNTVIQLIQGFISIVGTVSIMLYMNVWLALLTILLVPLMLKAGGSIAKRSSKYYRQQQSALGKLNGYIEETVTGQKVVKVFCHEEKAVAEFTDLNNDLRKKQVKAQFLGGIMGPVMGNIGQVSYGITACVGGLFCLAGRLSLGGLTVFVNYSRQFSRPINEISMQINTIFSALAGAERVFKVMDEEPEEADKSDAVEMTNVKGEVIMEDVSFGYNPDKVILKHINLYAHAGQKVAFVGSTGAGKTTITNLLNRFYDIQEGKITIDGRDIKDYARKSLRSHIAMVLQDTHLFTGTVRENIRYGRPDATDEEVEQAAKTASAHSFIMRLENGYDTMLEGDGINLSQGQRQLLNIARAAVSKAPILVLDEATSSVDTRTEMHIDHGMERLMKNRTTFVIAHRLSTVRNADCIMVLEQGEIIERGTHEQLLAEKGRYYQLYTGAVELD